MTDVVLDASTVLKWFRPEQEERAAEALALRQAFEKGTLVVSAPPLLLLEILNVAGRKWRHDSDTLAALASKLDEMECDSRAGTRVGCPVDRSRPDRI